MNYVITVVKPSAEEALLEICRKLELPVTIGFHGRGTALKSMLDLLGIESTEKRIIVNVASSEKASALMRELKRSLYIGVPGHGISAAVPIKSVGGGKTLAYLNDGGANAKYTPELDFPYELLIAIANSGRTDMVMNAARAAGARGGTVIHGKGTGSENAERFYNVSIASEKELVMIVAEKSNKSDIMKAIVRSAGPDTEAGAIVFSLPISEAAGFALLDEN